MNLIQAIAFVILGSIGAWFHYVSLARSRAVADIRSRMIDLAKSLWIEATDANLSSSPIIVDLHNSMIEIAALSPFIAAGLIVAQPDPSVSSEEIHEWREFMKRNRWLMNYVVTANAAVMRLEFHAKPWRIERIRNATFGFLIMKFVRNRYEPSWIPVSTDDVAEQAQRIKHYNADHNLVFN